MTHSDSEDGKDSSSQMDCKTGGKIYIDRNNISSTKRPPVISHDEIKKSAPRKRQDTFNTLKRDTLKSLGDDEFAESQWKVIESYIYSRTDKESKRVAAARASSFGTIDELFNLIDKEVSAEFKTWSVPEEEEGWD